MKYKEDTIVIAKLHVARETPQNILGFPEIATLELLE